MKKIIFCLPFISLLAVHAQTITWQTPQLISGASDVSTLGTYFGSWAPGDGNAINNNYPVNGVVFQGFSDLPSLNENFSGGGAGSGGYGSPGTANANYNTLLESGLYANGSGSSTFSWGGMTTGHTYELQFWVEDTRGITGARWENLSGGDIGTTAYGTDSSAAVGFSSPLFSGAASSGYYITGTFLADSTGSEEILLTPFGSNPDTQVNLFQVRDITPVPEPSALYLMSGSGVLLLLGFRRRA